MNRSILSVAPAPYLACFSIKAVFKHDLVKWHYG